MSLRPGQDIPLDLLMELFNKLIKEVRQKLGPNATNQKCITRHCNAIGVNKDVLDNFYEDCRVIRHSGKHVTRSTRVDLEKIIGELCHSVLFSGPWDEHITTSTTSRAVSWKILTCKTCSGGLIRHKKNIELARRAR